MKTLIALLTAAIAITPAAVFAQEGERDQTIYDRSPASVMASLAEKGIAADHVEEWGGAIRVDARNADGSNYFMLVEPDTLEVRQPVTGVATQLSVRPTDSGWTAQTFNSTDSIVDSNDDD